VTGVGGVTGFEGVTGVTAKATDVIGLLISLTTAIALTVAEADSTRGLE
jgi:hypothetical protein